MEEELQLLRPQVLGYLAEEERQQLQWEEDYLEEAVRRLNLSLLEVYSAEVVRRHKLNQSEVYSAVVVRLSQLEDF